MRSQICVNNVSNSEQCSSLKVILTKRRKLIILCCLLFAFNSADAQKKIEQIHTYYQADAFYLTIKKIKELKPRLQSRKDIRYILADCYWNIGEKDRSLLLFSHNGLHTYEKQITRNDFPQVLKRKLPFFQKFEPEMAVDFRSCVGSKCPYKGQCSYINGLRKAKESDIIIGNHSLMFSWPKGFPRPLHIVVDEAHRLEKEATDIFSKKVSHFQLDSLGIL